MIYLALSIAVIATLTSCIYDAGDEDLTSDSVTVQLTISTRGMTTYASSDGYEDGTGYENYVDIAHNNYRIYFFTNEAVDSDGHDTNTLLAEFTPTYLSSGNITSATYKLTGLTHEEAVEQLTNFKVLVAANWDSYPRVYVGTTTIDDICSATTYSAMVSDGIALMPSERDYIPLFGIREFSNVSWAEEGVTALDGTITLLRAMAKVEVICEEGAHDIDNVEIVRYNSTGYCAPAGVYQLSDYDHDQTYADDYVQTPHLYNNSNDNLVKRQAFYLDDTTWTIYLPEYDNSGDDFSYINVTIEGIDHPIYFGEYDDNGQCTAYTGDDTTGRVDILRNNLYRFYLTIRDREIQVEVKTWENVYDNEFSFEMDAQQN